MNSALLIILLVVGHETHCHRQDGHRMLIEGVGIPGRPAGGQNVADVGLIDHVRAALVFGLG